MNKTLLFLSLFMLLSASGLWAQGLPNKSHFKLLTAKNDKVHIQYSPEAYQLTDMQIEGEAMKMLEMPGTFLPNNEGMPNLPGESRVIAVPKGAKPILKVISYKTKTISNINIAPAPRIPFDTEPDIEYKKNEKAYSSNAFYPANPVSISEKYQIRGVDAVMLGITPFQYNPVSKELIVYSDFEIEITFEGGSNTYSDERLRNPYWDQLLASNVMNFNSVEKVDYSKRNKQKVDGEAEYVIITLDDPDFLQWADSIKEFRRKQGIHTEVYTIDEIGGNTVSAIETWVDNAYNNWQMPPVAVLLMADYSTGSDGITSPEYSHPYSGTLISDNTYADVDGDNLPDIVFARMTAQNVGHLETMVTKFLDYERTPPTSASFYNNPITALGWQTERWFQICSEVVGGFWNSLGKETVRINEIYSGSPGSTWSTATNTATVVNYFGPNGLDYIPATPAELGNWSGGNATDINNAINSGAFMLQHRDHGMETGWGEPSYTNSDIDGLSNTELTYVWSINCLTGNFDLGYEVFAEKFHRYTYNGENSGALGIMAASQVSYSFVNDVFVWGAYDNMWPDFMPDYGTEFPTTFVLPAFGGAAGKHFLAQSSWPYNTDSKLITYRLFHHHGDAFMNVYTEMPQDLTVNAPEVHIFGSGSIDVTTDENAMVSLTYFDTENQETVILGTTMSDGGVSTITMDPEPVPGTEMLLTITKQDYYRYTKTITVVAPEGPYVVVDGIYINDGGNSQADYGETFNIDITVKNVGVDVSENVSLDLSTASPYIISLTNNTGVSFGNIAADGTATSSGNFTVEIANNVPDQTTVMFEATITDDYTKEVYESTFSFKVNAPEFSIGGLIVDDNGGNQDGILDAGETGDIIIETSNVGHADISNVIASLETISPHLTINTATTSPVGLTAGETGTFVFNVTADGSTPLGTPAAIDYAIEGGTDGQYFDSEAKEIVIGLIPVYNISDGGSVTACTGLFYDSGGENGGYSDDEDYVMTFYPATSGAMIEAEFLYFDVENNATCDWDYLQVYDGEDTGGELLGTFCGTDLPGPFIADNDAGALTFVFHSDYTVTEGGWEAAVSCYSTVTPSGTLSGGNSTLCTGNTTGTMTLQNNSASITCWQKRLDGGSWETIATTNATYEETITDAGTWEFRVELDNGDYYSNSIQITAYQSPVAGTASANPETVVTGGSAELTLTDYAGDDIQWQESGNGYYWDDLDGGTVTPFTVENITSDTYYRAIVSTANCDYEASDNVLVSVTLGVNTTAGAFLTVYPNPTDGILNINFNGISEVTQITLSDISGRVLISKTVNDDTELNVSEFAQGIYLLKVESQGETVIKQIILQ